MREKNRPGLQSGLTLQDVAVVQATDQFITPGAALTSLAIRPAQRARFFSGIKALQNLHTFRVQNPLITENGLPKDAELFLKGELFIAPEVMKLVLLEFIHRQQDNPKYDTSGIYVIAELDHSAFNVGNQLSRLLQDLKRKLVSGQNAKIIFYAGVHAHFIYFERRRDGSDYFYLFDSEEQSKSSVRPYVLSAFPEATIQSFEETLQVDFFSCATIAFKVLRLFCKLGSLKLDAKRDFTTINEQLSKYQQRRLSGKTIIRHGRKLDIAAYQQETLVDGRFNAAHILAKYTYLARANQIKSKAGSSEQVKALCALFEHPDGPDLIRAYFCYRKLKQDVFPASQNLKDYLKSKQQIEKFNDQDFVFFERVLRLLFATELEAIQYCEFVLQSVAHHIRTLHDLLILIPLEIASLSDKELEKAKKYCNQYPELALFVLPNLINIAKSDKKTLDILVRKLLLKLPEYKNASRNSEAAKLFAEHRISEAVFEQYIRLRPSPDLPFKTELTSSEGLHIRFIAKKHPLCAILGNLTGCCQRLDGLAKTAVEYGIEDPRGGFIGVFNKTGQIVAQAFVYLVDAQPTRVRINHDLEPLLPASSLLVIDSIELSNAQHIKKSTKRLLAEAWLAFFKQLMADHPELHGIAVGGVTHGIFQGMTIEGNFSELVSLERLKSKNIFPGEHTYKDFFSANLLFLNARSPINLLGFFAAYFNNPENQSYGPYVVNLEQHLGCLTEMGPGLVITNLEQIIYDFGAFPYLNEGFIYKFMRVLDRTAFSLLIKQELANPLPLCRTIERDFKMYFYEELRSERYHFFLSAAGVFYFSRPLELTAEILKDLNNIFSRSEAFWGVDEFVGANLENIIDAFYQALDTSHRTLALQVFEFLHHAVFSNKQWNEYHWEKFERLAGKFKKIEAALSPKLSAWARKRSNREPETNHSYSEDRKAWRHLDYVFQREALEREVQNLRACASSSRFSLFYRDGDRATAIALLKARDENPQSWRSEALRSAGLFEPSQAAKVKRLGLAALYFD